MALPASPPPLPGAEEHYRAPLVPVWAFLRRNRHVTVPLSVPPAFLAAGAALAFTPGSPAAVTAGSAVGVIAVSAFAHHKWDRKPEQWYARLSALAAGGWLSVTALAGLGWPELAAAAVLAPAWGIPWWRHKRPRKQLGHILAEWQAWWQHYAPHWNLAGSQVTDVTTTGVITTLRVKLWPGHQTFTDVQRALPWVESALQGYVEAGMTRAEVVKGDKKAGTRGDPSQVLVHLKTANPHDAEVAWDPALVPSSVTGPAPIGKDEGSLWAYGPLLANWFIIGRTRSGKSNELSTMLASWTACPDAAWPWIIDLKGGRSARPWYADDGWTATTIEEARLVLGAAVGEIRARALNCYDGNEQLVPTPERPAMLVVIDEAHGVTSDIAGDRECQRLAAIVAGEGSAVNVHLWVMTQYGALPESVGTEQIRGNLPNRMCFAVADTAHGQFALVDYANLDASKLENQGEFYYRKAHDSASAPCRGPHMPHGLVREVSARNCTIPRPPLRLHAPEWQRVYDSRHSRLPASFRPASTAPAPTQEAPMPAAPPPSPVTVPPTVAELAARIEAEVAMIPDLPDPDGPVDQAALRATVRGKKQMWARLLQDAPPGGIEPRTLMAGSGLGRSWTHDQLRQLTYLGVITKVSDGHYEPRAGQDVWDGLERIRTGLAARTAELAGV